MRRERTVRSNLESPLVLRATLPVHEAKRETSSPQLNPDATPRTSLRLLANAVSRIPAGHTDHKAIEVQRALRNLHLLMPVGTPLREGSSAQARQSGQCLRFHPQHHRNSGAGWRFAWSAAGWWRRESVTAICRTCEEKCSAGDRPAPRRNLRAGLLEKFHVGELDTLARLVKASLLDRKSRRTVATMPGGRRDFWRTAWKAFPLIRRRSAGWTRCWQVSSPRS